VSLDLTWRLIKKSSESLVCIDIDINMIANVANLHN